MAKSREKGSRRKGCVIPAVSIALIIAIFLGREIFIAFTATPGSSVNYLAQAADLIASYQPEGGENGWDAMLTAIDAYERVASADEQADWWPHAFSYVQDPAHWQNVPGLPTDEECVVIARRVLAALEEQGAWKALDEMANAPRFARPLPDGEHLLTLPRLELGKARSLSQALAADMSIAHLAGDDARVAQDAIRGFKLTEACAHQDSLIERIVGIGHASRVTEEIRAELALRPYSAHALNEIAVALKAYEFPPFELVLEGERLLLLDTIQWTHTDDGRGDGRLIVSQMRVISSISDTQTTRSFSTALLNLKSIAYPSKKQTTRQANEMIDMLLEYGAQSRQQRLGNLASPDDYAVAFPKNQVILRMLFREWSRVFDIDDTDQSTVAGTRTMVAIEQFNARHSRYPESLDNLVPELLAELPQDPFANDLRFIYRRIDPGNDAHGRAYLLYSVGYDGNDDDGLINEQKHFLAFRPGQSGIDFVFNRPRASRKDAEGN